MVPFTYMESPGNVCEHRCDRSVIRATCVSCVCVVKFQPCSKPCSLSSVFYIQTGWYLRPLFVSCSWSVELILLMEVNHFRNIMEMLARCSETFRWDWFCVQSAWSLWRLNFELGLLKSEGLRGDSFLWRTDSWCPLVLVVVGLRVPSPSRANLWPLGWLAALALKTLFMRLDDLLGCCQTTEI